VAFKKGETYLHNLQLASEGFVNARTLCGPNVLGLIFLKIEDT
jgi:hypothetical protein